MASKKTYSTKQAETMRTILAINYMDIDCFVAPTPKVDSGAAGKAKELFSAPSYSKKTKVSRIGYADVRIRFSDNGKIVSLPVEIKTNGGEITNIVKSLENGKNGLVVYDLNVCNTNTSGVRREVADRIMRFSTFISLLEQAGAIRYNKKATNGNSVIAIEPTKKALVPLLEKMTPYDDSRIMELSEIL